MKIRISKKRIKMVGVVLSVLIAIILFYSFRGEKKESSASIKEQLSTYGSSMQSFDKVTFDFKDEGENYRISMASFGKSFSFGIPKENFNYDNTRYLLREFNFVTCLKDKGVRIYLGNNQESVYQLQVISKFQFEGKRFITEFGDVVINCEQQKDECSIVGINSTPSVLYKGVIYPGTKSAKWFHGLAYCENY